MIKYDSGIILVDNNVDWPTKDVQIVHIGA